VDESRTMSLLFLPGASGNREFWQPVAAALSDLGDSRVLGWPGFGGVPHDPAITSFDDLVSFAQRMLTTECHLIAQSMGCVVAMRLALESNLVRGMVLVAPAGGIDMQGFGARDWRPGASAWHRPGSPAHFIDETRDYSTQIGQITCPALIVSGDRDALSPPSVGQRISALLPASEHFVVAGGEHDLGSRYADVIAPKIRAFLTR
jgi:pimeloyl-ACP methyl ester carboxylesterase